MFRNAVIQKRLARTGKEMQGRTERKYIVEQKIKGLKKSYIFQHFSTEDAILMNVFIRFLNYPLALPKIFTDLFIFNRKMCKFS